MRFHIELTTSYNIFFLNPEDCKGSSLGIRVNKVEQILTKFQDSHLAATPMTTANTIIMMIIVMRTIACNICNRNFMIFHLDVSCYLSVKCVGHFRGCLSVR